ncbi:MAG: hypothetical protein AAF614_17660 [Chloroflexota bacterium]
MSEEINDLYERIKQEANGLEALLEKLPGLSGYLERQRRREADQLLRQTIVGRLDEVRRQLGAVYQDLSRDIMKGIAYAESLGRADTNLKGLISKIEAAPVGYAPFFAAVKVDTAVLTQLYDFDEAMLSHVTQLAADVAALAKAVRDDGDVDGTIQMLVSNLREANGVFSRRQELLLGVESEV